MLCDLDWDCETGWIVRPNPKGKYEIPEELCPFQCVKDELTDIGEEFKRIEEA